MSWLRRLADAVFPHIEPLTPAQEADQTKRLQEDLAAIRAAGWSPNEERALDEAQRICAAEMDRVRTAETKATTYLAVLAALVPVIITLQAANWEKKAGPAPDAARLTVLAIATVYVAAAGYHAFKTLQVSGFQRIGEAEVADVWRTPNPLRKLTRGTLLASRNSRDAVNAKITRIRVTHEHLLRAFGAFILLLLLDPLFYAMGYRNAPGQQSATGASTTDRTAPGVCLARSAGTGEPRMQRELDRSPTAAIPDASGTGGARDPDGSRPAWSSSTFTGKTTTRARPDFRERQADGKNPPRQLQLQAKGGRVYRSEIVPLAPATCFTEPPGESGEVVACEGRSGVCPSP